jgi:hypothetical protein
MLSDLAVAHPHNVDVLMWILPSVGKRLQKYSLDIDHIVLELGTLRVPE